MTTTTDLATGAARTVHSMLWATIDVRVPPVMHAARHDFEHLLSAAQRDQAEHAATKAYTEWLRNNPAADHRGKLAAVAEISRDAINAAQHGRGGVPRLVPDVDEFAVLTHRVFEALDYLAASTEADDDFDEPCVLPPPVGRRAAEAFAAIYAAIRAELAVCDLSVANDEAALGSRPRLLAPDGHYEHAPARAIDIDLDHLDALRAAARIMATAITDTAPVNRSYMDLANLLHHAADDLEWVTSDQDVADALHRWLGIVNASGGYDALIHAIATSGDVVLDAAGEQAYQQLARDWHQALASHPAARYLY